MKKDRTVIVRLTPNQHEILLARVQAEGYSSAAEMIRARLFLERNFERKIAEIHDAIFNAKRKEM